MKKLLLAPVLALVLAVPAMAEDAAATATPAAAATTYEQAWTECAETTKDAQGDKTAAVAACMTEKGFEVKEDAAHDEHSALDGLTFADASATTAVTTTADGAVSVTTPGASVTTDAEGNVVTTTEGTTVVTEAPAADAAVTTETTVETTTEEKH
jgi:hypothetical protein